MKPTECNITYCFNKLTDIYYIQEVDSKIKLMGICSFHGKRHLPFVKGLKIRTEKTKKLIEYENKKNQQSLL